MKKSKFIPLGNVCDGVFVVNTSKVAEIKQLIAETDALLSQLKNDLRNELFGMKGSGHK